MSAASEPAPLPRARYADGRTAKVREVALDLSGDALVLIEAGEEIERWPYLEITLVEERFGDAPMRLRRGDGDGRLTIEHTGLMRALTERAPQLSGKLRHTVTPKRLGKWGAGVGITALAVYLLVAEMPALAARVVPLKWEEALGDAVVRQITTLFFRKTKTCAEPAGEAALKRLTLRLTGGLKTRYRFKVRVLDHKMVNAFAAPGGRVIIMRGLIDKAKSPDEVAGVLAHEIGHVVERHSTEALFRSVGFRLIISALVGNTTSIGSALAEFGTGLASLSYGRANEREADRVGVKLLNDANISGGGLATFFARIASARTKKKSKEGTKPKGKSGGSLGGIWSYLSTHPPSAERAKRIRATTTGRGRALSKADWAALKGICG